MDPFGVLLGELTQSGGMDHIVVLVVPAVYSFLLFDTKQQCVLQLTEERWSSKGRTNASIHTRDLCPSEALYTRQFQFCSHYGYIPAGLRIMDTYGRIERYL